MNLRIFFLSTLILFFLSCTSEKPEEKKIVTKDPKEIDVAVLSDLKQRLNNPENDSTLIVAKDTLQAFLNFKKFLLDCNAPLWTSAGKLNPLGDSLKKHIINARHFALNPEDYHASAIDSLSAVFSDTAAGSVNISALSAAELLLTDGFFKMAVHIHRGRFYPDSLLLLWKAKEMPSNWESLLKEGINKKQLHQVLSSFEPRKAGYQQLIRGFREFLYDEKAINFDSVAISECGDSLALLKEKISARLKITGEYDTASAKSDSVKLVNALKRFQKNWNMEPDGKIGKLTRQAFQYNREKVLRQMEMAIERWKWEPDSMPVKYFWINIPSFQLTVMEEDTIVMESNIVCGKPETQTPLLSSKLNFMTIYPYWNVPYSIASKEILPAVQRDTAYLRKKNMEVINSKNEVLDPSKIKWKRYNAKNLPYKFRQRIGEDNSLGVVKFNFNNKHGVYLHDTNSKRYFKTAARAQSHGCIRVEKYLQVARFLLRKDTLKIPYDTLDVYLQTPLQRKINLKEKIPIYTKYFTATTDSLGNLRLYLDIYRKDEAMAKMIYRKK